jgi:hypothetical protein
LAELEARGHASACNEGLSSASFRFRYCYGLCSTCKLRWCSNSLKVKDPRVRVFQREGSCSNVPGMGMPLQCGIRMETLIKVDPEKHMYRWYSMGIQTTLADGIAVIYGWGSVKSSF